MIFQPPFFQRGLRDSGDPLLNRGSRYVLKIDNGGRRMHCSALINEVWMGKEFIYTYLMIFLMRE